MPSQKRHCVHFKVKFKFWFWFGAGAEMKMLQTKWEAPQSLGTFKGVQLWIFGTWLVSAWITFKHHLYTLVWTKSDAHPPKRSALSPMKYLPAADRVSTWIEISETSDGTKSRPGAVVSLLTPLDPLRQAKRLPIRVIKMLTAHTGHLLHPDYLQPLTSAPVSIEVLNAF